MVFNVPTFVENILNRLTDSGYETYLVGGCIRDMLMGKPPKDWDITTSALPYEIREVFLDKKVINIGEKYGTLTVVSDEGSVEVTTFRSEGAYSDGRHPDWVSFEKTIYEDLARRDFTINSIAWNNTTGLIDPYGGSADLEKGLIRAVGNPRDRFLEDGLRMIRAVRFASSLNFYIDNDTLAAIRQLGDMVRIVSVERTRDEFFKILMSPYPSYGMKILLDTELINFVLPEIIPMIGFEQNNPHHDKDVFEHTLCVLQQTPCVLHIRLAALFHDAGKPYSYSLGDDGIGHFYGHNKKSAEIAVNALKRLKCSNTVINKTVLLVDYHMKYYRKTERAEIKRLIGKVGKENVFDLLILQKADAMCKKKQRFIANAEDTENTVREILERNEAVSIEDLAVNGDDLKHLGFKQGRMIGRILKELLDIVIENPELNDKDTLMKLAQNVAKFTE